MGMEHYGCWAVIIKESTVEKTCPQEVKAIDRALKDIDSDYECLARSLRDGDTEALYEGEPEMEQIEYETIAEGLDQLYANLANAFKAKTGVDIFLHPVASDEMIDEVEKDFYWSAGIQYSPELQALEPKMAVWSLYG